MCTDANPVRGVLDKKRSEEHLQSSKDNIKTKTGQERQKESKENISIYQKG